MIRPQYDGIWQDAERLRAFVDEWAQLAPELFPEDFDQGYCLHGFGRESRKLPGLKLRKIVLADGTPYWLRPSFVTSYRGKSGVEIRCQFIILARKDEPNWLEHRPVTSVSHIPNPTAPSINPFAVRVYSSCTLEHLSAMSTLTARCHCFPAPA